MCLNHFGELILLVLKALYDLFNSRINSLSMIDSYTMNNNYPRADIFSLSISDDYDIDSYTFSNYNIYTCGYSKIYSV